MQNLNIGLILSAGRFRFAVDFRVYCRCKGFEVQIFERTLALKDRICHINACLQLRDVSIADHC